MSNKFLDLIKSSEAKWVDFRFTDTKGKEQHVSYPAASIDEDIFEEGKMFDGSSIAGWKGIEASDMILKPDAETAFIDPFFRETTVVVTCDVIEPATMQGYDRDPRSIARRAEEYLKSTGIGDTAFFGPEPEFFVFDDVKWSIDMSGARHTITADEAAWSTDKEMEGGNYAHRPRVKGGYFPVPPVDSSQDMRADMCAAVEAIMGEGRVEVHHHEVASCQLEIGVSFNTLVRKADEVQQFKYAVHNVAHEYGKTATFMPKPMVGDNGSGMHVHMSISKDGKNTFAGDEYAGLSETALYFIGGIIKHARALNAITNPYLCFAALLMAGIDGIQNKIHPGEAADKNLYDLPPEEEALIPTVAENLEVALQALKDDHEFLTRGGVFTKDMLEAYIALKTEEVERYNVSVHPIEFDMYYSC